MERRGFRQETAVCTAVSVVRANRLAEKWSAAICAFDDATGRCFSGSSASSRSAAPVSRRWICFDGRPGAGIRPTRGAPSGIEQQRAAHAPPHVLFTSGDAPCAGESDPGIGRASGSHDDAAVHAPQSRCSRQCDPVARPPLEYPGVLETSCWRRRRPNPLSPTRSVI